MGNRVVLGLWEPGLDAGMWVFMGVGRFKELGGTMGTIGLGLIDADWPRGPGPKAIEGTTGPTLKDADGSIGLGPLGHPKTELEN